MASVVIVLLTNCAVNCDRPSCNFSLFLHTAIQFQENLLKTMIQMENTFFTLAERCNRDCLVICDRGTMDASACKHIISTSSHSSKGRDQSNVAFLVIVMRS